MMPAQTRGPMIPKRGDLTEAFDGIRTMFIAMGSVGIEGVL